MEILRVGPHACDNILFHSNEGCFVQRTMFCVYQYNRYNHRLAFGKLTPQIWNVERRNNAYSCILAISHGRDLGLQIHELAN